MNITGEARQSVSQVFVASSHYNLTDLASETSPLSSRLVEF